MLGSRGGEGVRCSPARGAQARSRKVIPGGIIVPGDRRSNQNGGQTMPRCIRWGHVLGMAIVAVTAGLLCYFPAAAEDKPPKEPAAKPAPERQPGARDALVIKDCRLSAALKQDLPALQAGQLLVIGTEVDDGEKVVKEETILVEYSTG